MSDNSFDALSKMAAKSATRRQTLRGLGTVLGGALLATLGVKSATAADPQTCVTCTCGVGRSCNAKQFLCTPVRAHQDEISACQGACSKKNYNFCGQFSAFHCPQGCPS